MTPPSRLRHCPSTRPGSSAHPRRGLQPRPYRCPPQSVVAKEPWAHPEAGKGAAGQRPDARLLLARVNGESPSILCSPPQKK